MKIYLDDERKTPEGWIRCFWPEEVILLLQSEKVEEISLDHDLGEAGNDSRTGYDVLLWIEEQVFLNAYNPPKMIVHSANPVARAKMSATIRTIEARVRKN